MRSYVPGGGKVMAGFEDFEGLGVAEFADSPVADVTDGAVNISVEVEIGRGPGK